MEISHEEFITILNKKKNSKKNERRHQNDKK